MGSSCIFRSLPKSVRRGVVIAPGDLVGNVVDHGVDDRIGHSVDVLDRHLGPLHIGADLFDLRDQARHQAAAGEDQMLGTRYLRVSLPSARNRRPTQLIRSLWPWALNSTICAAP